MFCKTFHSKFSNTFQNFVYLIVVYVLYINTTSEEVQNSDILEIETTQGNLVSIHSDDIKTAVTATIQKPNDVCLANNIFNMSHTQNQTLIKALNYDYFIKPFCTSQLNLAIIKLFLLYIQNLSNPIVQQNLFYEFFEPEIFLFVIASVSEFQEKYPRGTPKDRISNYGQTIEKLVIEIIDFYLSKSKLRKADARDRISVIIKSNLYYEQNAYKNLQINPINIKNPILNEADIAKYYDILASINEEILIHFESQRIQTDILNIVKTFREDINFDPPYANFMDISNLNKTCEFICEIFIDLYQEKTYTLQPDIILTNLNFSEQNVFDIDFDVNIKKLVNISENVAESVLYGDMKDLEHLKYFKYIYGDDDSLINMETTLVVELLTLYSNMQKQRLANEKPTVILQMLSDIIDFINFIMKNQHTTPTYASSCKNMIEKFNKYKVFLESLEYESVDNYGKISNVTFVKILTFSIEIQCNLLCKLVRHKSEQELCFTFSKAYLVGQNTHVKLKANAIFMRHAFLSNTNNFIAMANYLRNFSQNQKYEHNYSETYENLRNDLNQNLVYKKQLLAK